MASNDNNLGDGAQQPPATTTTAAVNPSPVPAQKIDEDDPRFDETLILNYPKSNKKLNLHVSSFGIDHDGNEREKNGQSIHISPYGIEFRTTDQYAEGALIKIQVRLPDYWSRKQKFVEYGRVDNPTEFRVLAKVVRSEEVGKRGKKQLVIAQTLIMDSVDEKVLKSFLQEE